MIPIWPCLVCRSQEFLFEITGYRAIFSISPLAGELPDARGGRLKKAARPNLKEHMNHARSKRMRRKLGKSATVVAAIMCQEKRNCKPKRKRGQIREVTNDDS